MRSTAGVGVLPPTGFPIRTSWDRSLFDSYPRLIAAYHVLHRLLAPRHPPCTLSNLTTFILVSPPPRSRRIPTAKAKTMSLAYRHTSNPATAPAVAKWRKPFLPRVSLLNCQRTCHRRGLTPLSHTHRSASRRTRRVQAWNLLILPGSTKPHTPLEPAQRPETARGGDERDRTADLLVANQALSQLSYVPSIRDRTALTVLSRHDRSASSGPRNASGPEPSEISGGTRRPRPEGRHRRTSQQA